MNKILKTSFFAVFFVLLLGTTCFAGSFDTGFAPSSDGGSADPGKWALSFKDFGTRYVFRIDGVEIDRKYYINHLYEAKNEVVTLGSGREVVKYKFPNTNFFSTAPNSTSSTYSGQYRQ